jgi:hypothetical protein
MQAPESRAVRLRFEHDFKALIAILLYWFDRHEGT